MIKIEEFLNVELKVGTILGAEEVEGSDKLIKLRVALGEESPRQILAGFRKWYTSESLVGRQVVVVANLEPRVMMGYESQGMLLAASCDDPSTSPSATSSGPSGSGQGKPILLKPSSKVPNGTKIL